MPGATPCTQQTFHAERHSPARPIHRSLHEHHHKHERTRRPARALRRVAPLRAATAARRRTRLHARADAAGCRRTGRFQTPSASARLQQLAGAPAGRLASVARGNEWPRLQPAGAAPVATRSRLLPLGVPRAERRAGARGTDPSRHCGALDLPLPSGGRGRGAPCRRTGRDRAAARAGTRQSHRQRPRPVDGRCCHRACGTRHAGRAERPCGAGTRLRAARRDRCGAHGHAGFR